MLKLASYCATLVYGYGKSFAKNCFALFSVRSLMMTLSRPKSLRWAVSTPAVLTRNLGLGLRFLRPLPDHAPCVGQLCAVLVEDRVRAGNGQPECMKEWQVGGFVQ